MQSTLRHSSFALLLLAALALTPSDLGLSQESSPSPTPSWEEVDRLMSLDRYQAALEATQQLLTRAQEEGDAVAWTRALVRETQLRMGLHGYETAVRFLAEQPWPDPALPEARRSRIVLSLFYARALTTYVRSYSWEIAQRETMESSGTVDLKAWTQEQILHEARRALLEAWDERQAWGTTPLGELAEHFDEGTYPPRVRGTLRDTVSYLFAELLGDAALWLPAQSNAVYRLDLGSLIAGTVPAERLDDAGAHPLEQVAVILADLEAWHRRGGRPEAAFEARRVRLVRLAQAFHRDDEQEALRRDLKAGLNELGRGSPWWSSGMASLAEMVRRESDPDSQIRARDIALEGERAHPESLGGQQCRYQVAALEAPMFSLNAMIGDGVGRPSVRVEHKNLSRLHLRAYALDLDRTVAEARDYNTLPQYREVDEILAHSSPVMQWSEDLPPTPDLRPHARELTPPLVRPGLYLLVASAREDFAAKGNRRSALTLMVTDLVMLTRALPGEQAFEVTVRSGKTGRALPGVEVTAYARDYKNPPSRLARRVTAADGRVRFPSSLKQSLLVARHGLDRTLSEEGPWYFQQTLFDRDDHYALLYTDRTVYRPLQTVQWKAVVFLGRGEEGRFRAQEGKAVRVRLIDPNGEEVASAEVETGAFGSASGTFDLPAGRLLGSWSLNTSYGGAASIQVEEYKRPTFEVALEDPASPLRLNRPAAIPGEARYFFGLPVSEGEVTWRVERQPQWPWWWSRWSWWSPAPAEVVAAGTTELDSEGRFEVRFTPEADERDAESGLTYRFRLLAEVTDPGGETRSTERSVRLGFVGVETRLAPERAFVLPGEEVRVRARRSDLDGTGRPGTGEYRLLALRPPDETPLPAEIPRPRPPGAPEDPYATAEDLRPPRWEPTYDPLRLVASWPEGEEILHGEIEHGASGEGEISLSGLAAGAYRLHYRTLDAHGAVFEASRDLIVAEEESPSLPLPALLLADRPSAGVGETLRLLALSGLEAQEMVLEIFRGQRRLRRLMLSSREGSHVLELPLTPELRGGFSARLIAVRDHQVMTLSQSVLVPWEDRRLHLELASFRDRLRPGQRETWTVKVKDAGSGKKGLEEGAAEVLAYMYDRSLDLFAEHRPPDGLAAYPTLMQLPYVASTPGRSYEVWQQDQGFAHLPSPPSLRAATLKVVSGYAIGGPGPRMMRTLGGYLEMERVAEVAEDELRDAAPMRQAASKNEPPAPAASPPVADLEAPTPTATPEAVRTDFRETALWEPHLLTGPDGTVAFEVTVPDSVTEWSLWLHALTRDLRAGSLRREARTVKELLVRPYLPRFLREGDEAILQVALSNAGEDPLAGSLDIALNDGESGGSVLADFGLAPKEATGVAFRVEPGATVTLPFRLQVPPRVGTITFEARATAGDLSDGERRPLPVLPGRFHLIQSRFAALSGAERRSLSFPDLAADDDPSRRDEALVVTINGQLFYSVLEALPYLVSYPYECTEQTLNRFLSTGIVSSVFHRYPAVARMAKELSQRETQYEAWDDNDPNRKMALEETPWLAEARGGREAPEDLLRILDPRVAKAQRRTSLAQLEKAQTSLGGFPWWPGGPPSPFMTLYLLDGFSRALEFGVEVPPEMVRQAWDYLHRHYVDDQARRLAKEDCCWETLTYLGYVLSAYPDESWTGGVFSPDDRRQMLEVSWRHWQKHSPRLKAYLALTLHRVGREEDARTVFESLMDSARTDPDLGTYWAPEARSWLWYNDTVESQAFALRALTELSPNDPRRHGLAQWLLLDKKLSHWKSTRATAEAIYALVHYLERDGSLGVREEAVVSVGPRRRTFTFEPDRYEGRKSQLVIAGEEIDPRRMSEIVVEKETPGFLFAAATWHFSTEKLPEAASHGNLFSVGRSFHRRFHDGQRWVLRPLADGEPLSVGDQVEVHLSLGSRHQAEYVHLRDPRGAGFEPETLTSGYHWNLGVGWYEEVRDSGTNFFFEALPTGEHTFKYRLRVAHAGVFKIAPAQVQSMYSPDQAAYSSGARITVAAQTAEDRNP